MMSMSGEIIVGLCAKHGKQNGIQIASSSWLKPSLDYVFSCSCTNSIHGATNFGFISLLGKGWQTKGC
jgi:hypothetical protein